MWLLRTLLLSATGVVVALMLMFVIAFVTGISMAVPGVVAVESVVTGPPSASMTLGPGLVPVVAGLAVLIEVPGRLRARRALVAQRSAPEPCGAGR
ncbi:MULTISPECIES: hypothetical protein [Pseudonocardia]|uniref:Uncharacterized protein n=2 Tax=Pseudonocardia TaxID=1847 RepID=A0A1Y2N821_PSEAH|nr:MULTISPECIES: hypothetical protein [Pseudonocardia]OSY43610.1 hypothetical protein BG845_00553 [Pseudonocardia autotrophica]TDN73399.1 hypothetical protein C8E95_2496 [Pseudonocardia autotrophica]BBG04138.1 hypothetical protein Pdca_53470 [Pseudonocardia autotrophica]GEC25469.1 hypothetical protein PSA01_24980 [Pseudonocardia saturnea]